MSQYINLWNVSNIGEGVIELTYISQYIALTGSEVTLDADIPFSIKLMRIDLYQTTSADVDSTNYLSYSIKYRRYGKFFTFYGDSASATVISLDFEDRYQFMATTLRIALIGTSTNRIYPVITLQKKG